MGPPGITSRCKPSAHENKDKAEAAEAMTQQTRGFMQQVRASTWRKYTPEEKVRIVLEGFRREVSVNELCRREGIKPGAGQNNCDFSL
jgi:transposase-like protein